MNHARTDRGFALIAPWVGVAAGMIGVKMALEGFVGGAHEPGPRAWDDMKHGIYGIVVLLSGIGAYYGGLFVARSIRPADDARAIREMADDVRAQALAAPKSKS